MARIYTRTGDGGETHLGDGSRDLKSGPRVELYGEIDELNSAIGCCIATLQRVGQVGNDSLPDDLREIQSRLFFLGTILAHPEQSKEWAAKPETVQEFGTAELEHNIDVLDRNLVPLKTFILPGGREGAAFLHLARTICRRVERRAVALSRSEPVPTGAIIYFNRLSDYLFTAARSANAAAGVTDVPWVGKPGAE